MAVCCQFFVVFITRVFEQYHDNNCLDRYRITEDMGKNVNGSFSEHSVFGFL